MLCDERFEFFSQSSVIFPHKFPINWKGPLKKGLRAQLFTDVFAVIVGFHELVKLEALSRDHIRNLVYQQQQVARVGVWQKSKWVYFYNGVFASIKGMVNEVSSPMVFLNNLQTLSLLS